jgi:hypothetical protein
MGRSPSFAGHAWTRQDSVERGPAARSPRMRALAQIGRNFEPGSALGHLAGKLAWRISTAAFLGGRAKLLL